MIFAFGEYELDEECFALRRRGRSVELQPKALELLLHLVRNRDRVVSKREILAAIWSDAVVTDGSLARAVSLARLAIGDRGSAPAVIVTVARKGYRFQAPTREAHRIPPEPAARIANDADPAARYVGRAELISRLELSLHASLRGRGRILFLAGEAGIGKTRTAELLAEYARGSGARVVAAWGLEGEHPIYGAWTRLLRALGSFAPEAVAALTPGQRSNLAWLMPELRAANGLAPAMAQAGELARFGLFEAVEVFLTSAAELHPIALVLDDLHEADAESLNLLEFIGHSLGSLPIAIVVTCREDQASRSPEQARALERLFHLTSLERWPLAGLRGEEVSEFVRVRLGTDPDPALLAVLERTTAGNPLLLSESLRSLNARGLLRKPGESFAWDELLPQGIRHLLLPKLRRLSPGAVETLACAAAVGLELDRDLLALCLRDSSPLDTWLVELSDAAFLRSSAAPLGRLSFSHDLVREALYAELVPPGEKRRELHARIATALEGKEGSARDSLGERARHACEAVPIVEPRVAAARARAAGEQAAALHEFERAATWFQRALDVLELDRSVEPVTRAELYLALGSAQVATLGLEHARNAFRRAADHARALGRGDLLGLAALGFAHRPTATGHGDPEVIELLEEAARAVPELPEALQIRMLSRLAAELRYAEPPRAEALADRAVAAARSLQNAAVLGQVLDDFSHVKWSPSDTPSWIALNGEIVRAARAANDLELVLVGQKGRVTGLLELGDMVGVRRELRACERTAEALRTPFARWYCAALNATDALVDGDLEKAERLVAEAIPFGARVDSEEVALELYVQLIYVRLEQGRAGEIESAVRARAQLFPDAPAWRAAFARVLVATGRSTEAREELARLAGRRFSDVPHDRGWLPTLAMAAEVARAVGDVGSAEILEPLLLPYAHLAVVIGSGLVYYGSVSHHLGLIAATRSRWEVANACFDAALEAERRAGARIWETRTQIAQARALLERDARADRPRAADLLGKAMETARTHGLVDVAGEGRDVEAALWGHRTVALALPGRRPR